MEQSPIKIEIAQAEGRSDINIVKVEGILDSLSIPEAEKRIGSFIEEGKHLIIDCTGLSYINSTGLSFLMKCHIQMKRRSGSFKLVNPNKLISDLLETCGVWNFLEIYNSLKVAIKTLEKK